MEAVRVWCGRRRGATRARGQLGGDFLCRALATVQCHVGQTVDKRQSPKSLGSHEHLGLRSGAEQLLAVEIVLNRRSVLGVAEGEYMPLAELECARARARNWPVRGLCHGNKDGAGSFSC